LEAVEELPSLEAAAVELPSLEEEEVVVVVVEVLHTGGKVLNLKEAVVVRQMVVRTAVEEVELLPLEAGEVHLTH
jgi:hypothetical protein